MADGEFNIASAIHDEPGADGLLAAISEKVVWTKAERHAKRQALWEEKKQKKKQLKKQRQAEKPKPESKELDMSEEAVLRRRERSIAKRESFLMASEEGYHIVIDCGFEEQMTEKEKKSLSQQIMYDLAVQFSYGVNRRSEVPVRATITSLRGDTKDNLVKISGFNEWLAFKSTALSYMELLKPESLVYLTADSPNTITSLDKNKVYIIGGIVDRNRLKGATYNRAIADGIATAKLPLDDYLQMGSATRVLTVNHVFEILVRFGETHDWKQATLSTLPSRKGVEEKVDV